MLIADHNFESPMQQTHCRLLDFDVHVIIFYCTYKKTIIFGVRNNPAKVNYFFSGEDHT